MRVSSFLNGLAENVIRFPTRQEQTQTAEYYFQQGKNKHRRQNIFLRSVDFQGSLIRCIDGCHIPIDKPSRGDIDYLNWKDFYSIVLQGACNSRGKKKFYRYF
ncbi:hypothetical protein QE152_g15341 [Popillia japonica]|uniref:Uncharacterized protein n=1 Tax=Popillia japonica TaxID=7064 RepID=A0AAW1L7I5_POPJA